MLKETGVYKCDQGTGLIANILQLLELLNI